jgi:hypothetical protein
LSSATTLAQELTGSGLKVEESNKVKERIAALLKMINSEPKTKNWEKREKTGTNKRWYREVGEVTR